MTDPDDLAPTDADRSVRERMLAGEAYLADDPELIAMHQRAVGLMDGYNAAGRARGERRRILRELFSSVGEETAIRPPLYVDYGAHISIGARCFANYGLMALDVCEITIGDNVWLGGGVIVLAGVSIGDNTVVGAGAVVTKDLPADVVAVGNPARVVRSLE